MSYFYTGPPNWVFSMFAFIGFLCSTIPLPWHLEAWNTGTCLYMIWTALACLVFFVDSLVWSGNVLDSGAGLVRLSTHFLNGFNLAIPACSLCINRRLYQIASVRTVTKTKAEKRRAILVDLAIGLGLPVLQIPLQYIVQGHRYNIFEDIGCLGETYETPVAIALFHLPPILVGCVSAIYALLSIRAFSRSRAQFKELLSASANANLNLNRYLRLMLLAGTDLSSPSRSASGSWYRAWISWADTHSNFSRVVQVPGVYWRANVNTVASLETTRWVTVACALLFFAYFGFADEAVKNYRGAYGERTLASSGPHSSQHTGRTMPVFIRKQTSQKHDSLFDSTGSFTSVGGLSYIDKEGLAGSFGALSSSSYDVEKDASSIKDAASQTETDAEGEVGEIVPLPVPAAAHTHTRPVSAILLPLPGVVRDAGDIV
ncbi:pheromone A receptor-domain-containing protein [Mycena haematopus]|nr:pheromone A receptor-domain-containing protein [Mycena haematopus]